MTEGISHNHVSSSEFPFDFARPKLSSVSILLRNFYRKVEVQSKDNPNSETELEAHVNFATALNTVLVWCGARPTTSPQWRYCSKAQIYNLINLLNYISREIPNHYDNVSDLMILERPFVILPGSIIKDSVVTRRDNPQVRFTTDPPIEHRDSGRELGMFWPNVDNFSRTFNTEKSLRSEFSIYEVASNTQIYCERYSRPLLSDVQMKEFQTQCREKIDHWNLSMEQLGLSYRFHGKWDEVPI